MNTMDNVINTSAFYDSDEDVAWGPVSMRERRRDLESKTVAHRGGGLSGCSPPRAVTKKETEKQRNKILSSAETPSKRKRTTQTLEFMEVCKRALEKPDTSEYEAVGINVTRKLEKMDRLQAIYAESLINGILTKGLLNQITPNTEIMENHHPLPHTATFPQTSCSEND